MLLYGHYLQAVVSVGHNTRQDFFTELVVGSYLLRVLSHTDVALINEQRIALRAKSLDAKVIGFGRCPHLCGKDFGLLVLHYTAAPGGYAFAASAVPIDFHLVEIAVVQSLAGQCQLPVARRAYALQLKLGLLGPLAKVANQKNTRGVGSPFSENPSLCSLVQTEV